ncbi:MAG: hypothetical protein KDE28_28160, partial [Anaerolineales bacterium]|nr:hypothetical protein [Anaerolineales bacterium]
ARQLIAHDIQVNYPRGIPNANALDPGFDYQYYFVQDLSGGTFPGNILQWRVLQYLNAESISFVDNSTHVSWAYNIDAYQLDSRNGQERFILAVTDKTLGEIQGSLFAILLVPVYRDHEGRYALAPNNIEIYLGPSLYGPTFTVAIGANLVSEADEEFLINLHGHAGGSHNYYDFKLYLWNDEGVVLYDALTEYYELPNHEWPAKEFQIVPAPGETYDALLNISYVRGFFGCSPVVQQLITWPSQDRMMRHLGYPDTSGCNAFAWYENRDEPALSLQYLQRAITQTTDKLLRHYLLLQLVFTHTLAGNKQAAEQVFQQLLSEPQVDPFGNVFVEYAQEATEFDAATLCTMVDTQLRQLDISELNSLVLQPRPYPIEHSTLLLDCWPYGLTLLQRVQAASAPSEVADTVKNRPDWYYVDESYFGQERLDELLVDLTQRIISDADRPVALGQLASLRNVLPLDEPELVPVFVFLDYLEAYGHELAGDDELAIVMYRQLLEQYPRTAWAWFAAARLTSS